MSRPAEIEFWILLAPDKAARIRAMIVEEAPGNAGEPDRERQPDGVEFLQIVKGCTMEQLSTSKPF